jgi:hypothetical protein
MAIEARRYHDEDRGVGERPPEQRVARELQVAGDADDAEVVAVGDA